MTTEITAINSGLTINISKLPKHFSFAYDFFTTPKGEMKIIREELKNICDENVRDYLSKAMEYLKMSLSCFENEIHYYILEHLRPKYIEPFRLKFDYPKYKNSVALTSQDRLEKEISLIKKELNVCKDIVKIWDRYEEYMALRSTVNDEMILLEMFKTEFNIKNNAEILIYLEITDHEVYQRRTLEKLLKYILDYLNFLRSVKLKS